MDGEFVDEFVRGYREGFVKGYEDGLDDGRWQGYKDAKRRALRAVEDDPEAKRLVESAIGEE